MKSPVAFTQQEENNEWYITFLKSKEQDLISKLGLRRIKTQKKVFYCKHGKIVYSFVYVRFQDRIFSPLREYLRLGKYANMTIDFKNKLIMKASRTTYQKAVEDIEDSFEFKISKKTLNRYVIDNLSNVEICEDPPIDQNILIADSTKVRNGKKGHHEAFAVMSLNYETNTSSLTAFAVNMHPKQIAAKIKSSKYKVFVGDGGLGLRNFFKDKIPFQICHLHVIRDVSFFLWRENMKKKERDPYMKKLKAILYTLQNSTKKYWLDNKTGRLMNRIIKTKKNLKKLAAEFSVIEKYEAARYLRDHLENIVTAARLALLGTKVPWTTNHVERLMQEIGIRTKKKGMNWTEKGLKAILNLVLARYFLPKEQRKYKEIFKSIKQVVEI